MTIDMELLANAAELSTTAYRNGMQIGAILERRKFLGILRAYDRALADPNVVIPTYLHAAIEGARSDLDAPAEQKAAA